MNESLLDKTILICFLLLLFGLNFARQTNLFSFLFSIWNKSLLSKKTVFITQNVSLWAKLRQKQFFFKSNKFSRHFFQYRFVQWNRNVRAVVCLFIVGRLRSISFESFVTYQCLNSLNVAITWKINFHG